ncbi:archaeal ATPase [Galdieria sulphuraria]|uniref:Archaeal ATPase n=1 Tax=Galdieria sulphuraria TaxID=130081 RepID=M2XBX7_GALSU|nr:archaeal ATPase [Galdieria sulphuraria]EME27387.1 archaeal ATPase [Galdieria sulphuraria]|eukprot:XP_005703907.1 archaeal ATPase [Galdieria sulphuraria]
MTSQEIRISLPGMTKVPLIDRKEDIYSILQTYFHQFSPVGKNFNIRPSASFSPHIFGAGKSFVGQNFLEFLKKFAEEEKEQKETEVFNKSSSGKIDAKIFSWKHFAENILLVCFELGESFSRAPFPRFRKALMYNIAMATAECNGMTAREIVEFTDAAMKQPHVSTFVQYLLEQFQKQYLFLMIDELSHLSYLTKYYSELDEKQFIESDRKYVPFRKFFRVLRELLITGKVIVYLAGRTDEISARRTDALSSGLSLHMLRLNPFNLNDIGEYLEVATYDGKSLKDWLLPSDDLRYRFVELLKKKTGGMPLIVRNTLLTLIRMQHEAQPVINNENMEPLLDSVFQDILKESTTFIIPEIQDSATLLRYQFVLLNYQLGTVFPIGFAITLCGTTTYLMDLVATFGFYCEFCGIDGIDMGTEFKIGCCEFILRAHSSYKFFREANEIFPLSPFSYISDIATAKGVFFEFIFMKIFRFRLLTFLHSNSSPIVHSAIPGIFQDSFIEQDNISYSMESTKSYDIPILRDVPGSFSDYYRKYLQRCGIFVPKEGNSSGPDAYVVFQNGQTRYVVGFSFKFYHKTGFSKSDIKEESEQFFKGVVSVLNDESLSSVQLCFQFVVVVCTSYDRSVGFSVEEQNIVEDVSYLVTKHSLRSTLSESSRSCLQLVIVSQRNLERFLGIKNYEILRKIGEASRGEFSKDFSVWCKTVFESMCSAYVSSLEAGQSNVISRVARNVRQRTSKENRMQMKSFQSAMQVEYKRDEVTTSSLSSVQQNPFDWMNFLKLYCHLTEEEASKCYECLWTFSERDIGFISLGVLQQVGIDETFLQVKVLAGLRNYVKNNPHT